MAAPDSADHIGRLAERIEQASPDLPRQRVKTFAEASMSAEADAPCGAPHGQPGPERVTRRNGHRPRE